ncbi:hypothetical protein BPO_0284 [Bergeyella porcorum]|uniref:Uncharacterized protein n=1 Tax=Bergeyella porcorum TaxID=1735111 RepID=A0AAU0EY71_9FLAO
MNNTKRIEIYFYPFLKKNIKIMKEVDALFSHKENTIFLY